MNFLKNKNYPWVVISFSALFLFYKYILQVSPSVMTNDLMQHFHLDGAGLGNLAAMYFYTYLVIQLFAGPLLDRLNPRVLTSLAIAVCATGAVLFSWADSLVMAWLARACIGVGAAFATVSYMKMATDYFSQERFAFVGGLLATAAMLGSMGGEAPLAWLVSKTGWQHSLFYCGVVGFGLALLFYFFVRNAPRKNCLSTKSANLRWQDFATVLKKKHNWLLMLYSGFAFTPLAVFGGLWGNPFLETAYHFSRTEAATLTSMLFLGLAIGSPVFGYLSDRFQNRFGMMFLGLALSLLSVTFVLYVPNLNYGLLVCLLFTFGFGTGAFMLGFTLGRDINQVALMATVVSLINTGDAILGAFSEPLVGKLLDSLGSGKLVNNVPVFSLHDFHLSLFLLPAYLLFAFGFLMQLYYSLVIGPAKRAKSSKMGEDDIRDLEGKFV